MLHDHPSRWTRLIFDRPFLVPSYFLLILSVSCVESCAGSRAPWWIFCRWIFASSSRGAFHCFDFPTLSIDHESWSLIVSRMMMNATEYWRPGNARIFSTLSTITFLQISLTSFWYFREGRERVKWAEVLGLTGAPIVEIGLLRCAVFPESVPLSTSCPFHIRAPEAWAATCHHKRTHSKSGFSLIASLPFLFHILDPRPAAPLPPILLAFVFTGNESFPGLDVELLQVLYKHLS